MQKKKTIHGQGRLCEYFLPPPEHDSVCLSVLSPSLPPFPLLPCPVAAHRFSIFVTFILYNLLSWQFLCRSPLAFFCAHALDNAVWIGQKLNSFAYMRIIYFVDSLSPPPLFQGDQLVKKKWKVKSETETGNWKTKSGKLCSLPNGRGSQSTKNTFIKSKQSLSWSPLPPPPPSLCTPSRFMTMRSEHLNAKWVLCQVQQFYIFNWPFFIIPLEVIFLASLFSTVLGCGGCCNLGDDSRHGVWMAH